jgi:N-acetylglutamate synthase-like GNAT family acetyltransferase
VINLEYFWCGVFGGFIRIGLGLWKLKQTGIFQGKSVKWALKELWSNQLETVLTLCMVLVGGLLASGIVGPVTVWLRPSLIASGIAGEGPLAAVLIGLCTPGYCSKLSSLFPETKIPRSQPKPQPRQGKSAPSTTPTNVTFSLSLRRAVLDDIEEMQKISAEAYKSAYGEDGGGVPKVASEDYRPRVNRGEVWLIESIGHLSGLMVLLQRNESLMIHSIAVRPSEWRRKLGSFLIMHACSLAADKRLKEVCIFTSVRIERNIAFCRSHGFSEVGHREHPDHPGELVVDLSKQIRLENAI